MTSLTFIILASFFNAVMDKVKFHYYKSTFEDCFPKNGTIKRLEIRRWIGLENSWDNKYINGNSLNGRRKLQIFDYEFNYPVWFCDLWHFSKSLMIVSLCLAIVCYSPIVNTYIDFVIYGMMWNIVFNVFFNKILSNDKNCKLYFFR